MSKEDIFKMLEKARKAGMGGYTAWGGEPLLRKDLPEILRFAKKNKLITTVITNGFSLKERCDEIAPFTDYLIVSIDSNDELHDKMRGVKGIRKRAIDGIIACKKTRMKTVINSVISNLNMDRIDGLFELSRELDVPLTFEPMEPMEFDPGYNEQFKLTPDELREVFSKIIKYKKSGYKVVNSIQYLRNFSDRKQYVCHAPKFYVTVDAQGNITTCFKGWGNIKEKSFEEIFRSAEFKEFGKKMEKCNKCNASCIIETSLAYSLNPLFLLDKIKFL